VAIGNWQFAITNSGFNPEDVIPREESGDERGSVTLQRDDHE
jgi:hypothetical protein